MWYNKDINQTGGEAIQLNNLTASPKNDIIKVSFNRTVGNVGNFDAIAHYNQYKREHYDRLSLLIPKGGKQQLQELAKNKDGISVNKLIIEAIEKYYKIKL